MRSDLVFTANTRVSNRFLLCHFVRLATKAFHKDGVAVQETINRVLTAMGDQRADPPLQPQQQNTAEMARTDATNLEIARAAFHLMAAERSPATT